MEKRKIFRFSIIKKKIIKKKKENFKKYLYFSELFHSFDVDYLF